MILKIESVAFDYHFVKIHRCDFGDIDLLLNAQTLLMFSDYIFINYIQN